MSEEQVVNENQSAEAPETQKIDPNEETPNVSAEPQKPLEPAPDFSKQFAELRQREKAVRLKELEAKRKGETQLEDWKKKLQVDPMAVLQEQGINLQEFASSLLNVPEQNAPSDIERVQNELLELKEWRDSQLQSKQQADQQKAIDEYKAQVFNDLESDESADYEILFNHPRGKQYYWDAVLQYSSKYGEAPSLEERKEMASKLESQLFDEVSTLSKLSKFETPKQPEAPKEASSEPKAKGRVTLNNSMSPRYKISNQTNSKKSFSSNDHFDQVFNKFFSK